MKPDREHLELELEKQWWKISIINPEYAAINPGGVRNFEFPSIDVTGARKLGDFFTSRFPGFKLGVTKVILYPLPTPSPPETRQ